MRCGSAKPWAPFALVLATSCVVTRRLIAQPPAHVVNARTSATAWRTVAMHGLADLGVDAGRGEHAPWGPMQTVGAATPVMPASWDRIYGGVTATVTVSVSCAVSSGVVAVQVAVLVVVAVMTAVWVRKALAPGMRS
jgi:hypothetical protein